MNSSCCATPQMILDTLFSSGSISELEAVGCKPILLPDLEAKRKRKEKMFLQKITHTAAM